MVSVIRSYRTNTMPLNWSLLQSIYLYASAHSFLCTDCLGIPFFRLFEFLAYCNVYHVLGMDNAYLGLRPVYIWLVAMLIVES